MKPRRPLYLLLGGLCIILAAQVLNHVQVQASTEKALTQAQVSHNLIAARDLKLSFEQGMGFGKPLSLYSGTDKLFANLKSRYDGIEFLALTGTDLVPYSTDPDSPLLASIPPDEVPVFPAVNLEKSESSYKTVVRGNMVLIALPLYFNHHDLKGITWLGFSRGQILAQLEDQGRFGLINLAVLLILTSLLFFFAFRWMVKPVEGTDTVELHTGADEKKPQNSETRFYLPLLTRVSLLIVGVLILGLLGYTLNTNGRFTASLVTIYERNVELLARSQAQVYQKVLDWGVPPEHWKKTESQLAAQIRNTPEATYLTLTDPSGKVLYSADHQSTYPASDPSAQKDAQERRLDFATENAVRVPLAENGVVRAYLWGKVSQAFLDGLLLERLLDALTVTLVSLVFSVELLLALGLFSRLPTAQPLSMPRPGDSSLKIIRFTAFLFFMAELLPLPFLPLFISDLYAHSPLMVFQFSPDAVKGLPFSAHLVGVMIFVPVIGSLTRRFSLRNLFLFCGGLLLLGNFLAAYSPSLGFLMLFRFISGLGYGGVLAASTGLVILTTDKSNRTSGFAAWGAGFAAASICAVALGGILVTHVGYRNGLLVSAGLTLLLGAFVVLFHPVSRPEKEAEKVRSRFSDFLAPFRDRSALITLLFASIPIQLAFFGLFQYSLPLAMNQIGVNEGNIGRILTIYGLISLASPILARFSDRTRSERLLILAGNLITGVVLMVFFLQSGVWFMIFAVAAIGVGGLLFDTVNSSYLSMTKISERLGETRFLSIFLTWEKFFTIFVPIVVGTLMTSFGYVQSAAVLGVFITVGALVFLIFSGKLNRKTDQAGSQT